MTTRTVLDALIDAIKHAGRFHHDSEVGPMAILWPDGGRQWEQIIPQLREYLTVYTLGDYDPDAKAGPAIWIRAELANHDTSEEPPIVYLPGVSRDVLRRVEEAPNWIEPLVYLQYRGAAFLQPNGKDWTVPAFLQNAKFGLGLEVDKSAATRSALASTARQLVLQPVDELQRRPGAIDADFLHTLIFDDVPRMILDWIDDDDTIQTRLDDGTWKEFRALLKRDYGVDPELDGAVTAAQKLGEARVGSRWETVWTRFAEAPTVYATIPDMLRGVKPADTGQRGLFPSEAGANWPQDNEEQEQALRDALLGLEGQGATEARQAMLDLERSHGPRRDSVWARLGQAPLAHALRHLASLAEATMEPYPAGSVATMQRAYVESGWRIDTAALDAVTAVRSRQDRAAIDAALDATYSPWLWDTAVRFQEAVQSKVPTSTVVPLDVPPGTCVVFADGLRYDLAGRLREVLTQHGLQAEIADAIGPLPGVTPSAKPAQSPVVGSLVPGNAIDVKVRSSGTTLNQTAFRKLLDEAGWSYLERGNTGRPEATDRAWTEEGEIDSYGHSHPADLPDQVARQVDRVSQRIRDLLEAGWPHVMVITDHGWLLTPRPMEKTELPQHLTAQRKGRCARLNAGSATHLQTVPWCWDTDVRIAMAPGTSCFEVGKRYEHGGLSLQECIVPTITVSQRGGTRRKASIAFASIVWRGLRCQVELDGDGAGLQIDIRQRAGDPATSLAAAPQRVNDDGTARVLVTDDAYEETSAIIVVLDETGLPVAQQATIVRGE